MCTHTHVKANESQINNRRSSDNVNAINRKKDFLSKMSSYKIQCLLKDHKYEPYQQNHYRDKLNRTLVTSRLYLQRILKL